MKTPGKVAATKVALDDSPGVVRYVQLANFVRHKIVSNEWPVGSMLPTVQDFSERLGIARVTVRHAYAILVNEGLISSERGRGTQVTASPAAAGNEIRAAINNWLDVPDGFQIRMLEKQADVALPAQLLLSGTAADSYMRLKKLHLHSSQIICLAEFYIETAVFSRFPKDSERKSKIAWLLPKYSMQDMKYLHQVITVSQADHEMARILKYPFAAPIATVKRCITNDVGTVIYASTTWYRGDHFIFDMTLPVNIMYGKQLNTGQSMKKKRSKQ